MTFVDCFISLLVVLGWTGAIWSSCTALGYYSEPFDNYSFFTWNRRHMRFMPLILFNLSVMSDSLWPHGLQHARLPCPSPSPRVCTNSYPLSWWCHPTISSSCLQAFLASGSFPMSQFFSSGGQSIGASASASVLPMNIQGWFLFGLTGFCFAFQGTLKSFLQHHSLKASVLQCSVFFPVHLSHQYMITGKTVALTIWIFAGKVMSELCNTLPRFVIAFLPRSKNF